MAWTTKAWMLVVMGSLVLPPWSPAANTQGGSQPETVALFDFQALETPESVVVDPHGNRFVSLALTGKSVASPGTAARARMHCCPSGRH